MKNKAVQSNSTAIKFSLNLFKINLFYFVIFQIYGNLVKCMDCMLPCYSILKMTVLWLYYLVLINPYKFISSPNNFKDIKEHIYAYLIICKIFSPVKGNSFQRKPKLIATPYILQYVIFIFKTVFISEQIEEGSFGAS